MPRESFDETVRPEVINANEAAVEVSADDLMEFGSPDGAREAAAHLDSEARQQAAHENSGGGVLRRLGEVAGKKGRALVAGVGLMSAAVAGQMAPEEAEAHHVQGNVSKEEAAKADYEHEVLNLGWRSLLKIPDQPQALNETHNNLLKEEVARNMIYRLAAMLKVGKNYKAQPGTFIHVLPQDMKKAAELLNTSIGFACAEANGGKECSLDDINQFNAKLMQTPSCKALLEILNRP